MIIVKKLLSEVGFEPTPSFEDQNAHFSEAKSVSLESGALDRSAILTSIELVNTTFDQIMLSVLKGSRFRDL